MTPCLKAAIAATLILIVWGLLVWFVCQPHPHIQRAEWTPQEKAWVIERLKYHGIWGCEYDGREYYFYRKGQRCRL